VTFLAEDQGASRGVENGGRTVSRRSNSLNGRALGGALLVAVAAVVVFWGWLGSSGSTGQPTVIVNRPLAAGTTLNPGDLTTARVGLPSATRAHTFANPSLLLGRVLADPLAPGELVQSSDLVAQGHAPPLRPVAVTVDTSDAGVLAVGDLVDVVVTDGTATASPTSVVLLGARVLALSEAAGTLAGANTSTVVTIGVSTLDEVTALIHAERTGTLNVVEGEAADGSGLATTAGSQPSSGP